jgi:hypothetical protein
MAEVLVSNKTYKRQRYGRLISLFIALTPLNTLEVYMISDISDLFQLANMANDTQFNINIIKEFLLTISFPKNAFTLYYDAQGNKTHQNPHYKIDIESYFTFSEEFSNFFFDEDHISVNIIE